LRQKDRSVSSAVYELVLQMVACYFAFGHNTPERRQILAHVQAVCGADLQQVV